MSDPVTNVPIEDVLSSIRKLVSEEVRAQVTPHAALLTRTVQPGQPAGKLILTPALRVVEGDDFGAEDEIIAGFAEDAEPEDEDTSAIVLRPFATLSRLRDRDAAQSQPTPVAGDVLWDAEEAGEAPVAASHRMGEEDSAETTDRRAPISDVPTDLLAHDTPQDDGDDALRDLVTEILRQELQGPLGERITRNVRKLVRSEIQRALNARDQ